MSYFLKISLFVILLTIIFMVVIYRYDNPSSSYVASDTITVTKVITDTVVIHSNSYVPKYIYRDTGSTVYHTVAVDTDLIIRSYFEKIGVIDTLVDDSMALVIITDTLYMNRIYSRTPSITFYPKYSYSTQQITFTSPQRVSKLYAGIFIGGNKDAFSLGPVISFIPNKQYSIGVSYNLMHKEVYFTLMYNPIKHP